MKVGRGQLSFTSQQSRILLLQAFGKWIKDHRKSLGWTKRKAAKEAGINLNNWILIELGLTCESRSTVLLVSRTIQADTKEALRRYRLLL